MNRHNFINLPLRSQLASILWIMGLMIGAISSIGTSPLGYKFGNLVARSINSPSPQVLGWYFAVTAAIPLCFLASKITASVFRETVSPVKKKNASAANRSSQMVFIRDAIVLFSSFLSALPFFYVTHSVLTPLIGRLAIYIDVAAIIAPTAVNRWALLSVINEITRFYPKNTIDKKYGARVSRVPVAKKILGYTGFINGIISVYQYWGNAAAAAQWLHLGTFGIYLIGLAALVCNGALAGYTGKIVFECFYEWLMMLSFFSFSTKHFRKLPSLASKEMHLKKFLKFVLIMAIFIVSISAATPNLHLTFEQISHFPSALKYSLLACSFMAPFATNFYSIYLSFYSNK